MNELTVQAIVDKTAEEIPGVYHIEYESGMSGVEFTNDALYKFVQNILQYVGAKCE